MIRPRPRPTLFPYTTLSDLACELSSSTRTVVAYSRQFAKLVWLCDSVAELLIRSEEHTSELQSGVDLVCRLLPVKESSPAGQLSTGGSTTRASLMVPWPTAA